MAEFTLNAWAIGGRHRHHRTRDHFGADSDLYVVIDEPVGHWLAGTPVKYVIEDLYDRIIRLMSYDHHIRVAYINAYVMAPTIGIEVDGTVRTFMWLNAVTQASLTSTFTLRALVIHGGACTIDAWVSASGTATLNSYVV